MTTRLRRALAALPVAGMLTVAGCDRPRLHADGAWVRLAAVPGRPAVAYLTVHGGGKTTTLTGVESDVVQRAEMHETMGSAGMTTMKPLAAVTVPAGGTVAFAPGGRHVMLFDVNPGVKPGDTLTLALHLAGAPDERVDARVVAPGDAAPR